MSAAAALPARLTLRARLMLDEFPVDAAWSPDGRALAVAGGEGAVLLLDVAGAIAAAPDGGSSTAAGSAVAGTIGSLGRHEGGVLAVGWQPAGALSATSGQDGRVQLWDSRTRQAQALPRLRPGQWVEHLAFAANGRLLAAAAGKTLTIFDMTGAVRGEFADHSATIAAIAWRPKLPQIAAVGNGGAWLHALEPRPGTRHYPWNSAALTASWSPDGRTLASGQQDGAVHLWYMAADSQSQMKGFGLKVSLTGWSANGRYLATAAGEALVLWDFAGKGAEGRKPQELRAHSQRIVGLAFRPAGAWLASTARDRRLLLWRAGYDEQPVDAHLLPAECGVLHWSNDGRWLAAADQSGGVSLFAFQG